MNLPDLQVEPELIEIVEPVAEQHPMLAFAGIFKNDPDFAEIVAQMRAEQELDDDNPAYTFDW
jgi:hypothetical protein